MTLEEAMKIKVADVIKTNGMEYVVTRSERDWDDDNARRVVGFAKMDEKGGLSRRDRLDAIIDGSRSCMAEIKEWSKS